MQRIKVLIAKPGLDGHEMGARLIAYVLRNAGMEVIYTGPRQTPEMIVAAALQEAVDVIGLSFLTGSHKEHTTKIMGLIKAKGMENTIVVVGGIIPPKDLELLKSLGVDAVFGPGSNTGIIAETIINIFKSRRKDGSAH